MINITIPSGTWLYSINIITLPYMGGGCDQVVDVMLLFLFLRLYEMNRRDRRRRVRKYTLK